MHTAVMVRNTRNDSVERCTTYKTLSAALRAATHWNSVARKTGVTTLHYFALPAQYIKD